MSTLLVLTPLAPFLYLMHQTLQALIFAAAGLLVGVTADTAERRLLSGGVLIATAFLLAGFWPCRNCRAENGLHSLEHVLWAMGAVAVCASFVALGTLLRKAGAQPAANPES